MSRYNRHRRDTTHAPIVEALRKMGCSVRDTSQIGDGGGDIVIGLDGRDYGAELKTDDGELSQAQVKFAREWVGCPPLVLRSVLEAVQWVNEMRCAL